MRVFIESYWNPKRSERIGDHRGEREIAQKTAAAAAVRSFVRCGRLCVLCACNDRGGAPAKTKRLTAVNLSPRRDSAHIALSLLQYSKTPLTFKHD